MAVEVKMPQLSDTMSDGTILAWLKKEGDPVKRGEALAEVATDKADLEIECFSEGTLLKIVTPEGQKVKVGAVIALIGQTGEKVEAVTSAAKVSSVESPSSDAVAKTPDAAGAPAPATPAQTKPEHAANRSGDDRVKASPLARQIASKHGVDVSTVKGSGEGGRITRKDVESVVSSTSSKPSNGRLDVPHRPVTPMPPMSMQGLSRMRQTIATRMVESKTTIPHFYMTSKVDAEALLDLRETLKELPQYEGITLNHLIIKAAALALRQTPKLNTSLSDEGIKQPGEINIGIVTALDDGLLIPVVRHADELALADIVQQARGLTQRARAGKPKQEDLVGATFSISNVGRFAVEHFSAIISPGQGGILAVSAISDEPVVKAGQVVAGKVLRFTLSVDHRVIDGVDAATFMTELNRLLEKPVLLLA